MKPFVPDPLPIQDIKWEPLIPLIGRANRAIAHYDGILYGVPNPDVLLSPLTTQEAVLSSRIEGTVATLSEVLKFEAGEKPQLESRRHDIQEIINYRRALAHAEVALAVRPLNLNLILELHSYLLDSVRGRDKGRGTFRKHQNWIGGHSGTPIEQAKFIPPDPLLVPKLLDAWEKYYHADRPDPLVQLAVVHAQFEIIHPFLDGNGRIGRILLPIFLHEKGLLSQPMFYLSGYFDDHYEEYIQRLRNIGREPDAWNQWIAFFLEAIIEQAQTNAYIAREIMALYDTLKRRVIELTHSQYAVPLLDQLFQRPLFKSSDIRFVGVNPPNRQTLSSLLRTLREDSIIKVVQEGAGRRAHLMVFPELINLCEGKKVF